jgi:hypothetical protein
MKWRPILHYMSLLIVIHLVAPEITGVMLLVAAGISYVLFLIIEAK